MFHFNFDSNFNNMWSYILLKVNQSFNIYTLNNLFFENKYFFIFLFLIYLGMILDQTFSFRSKIFIFFYFFFLVAMMLFFSGNLLIQEVFWYTLLLNGSFIFHVCLCNWFYSLFKNLGWDYWAFVITSMSFIFSLSFILYLSDVLYLKLHYYLAKLPSYTTSPYCTYYSILPWSQHPTSSESSWALFNHCLNIIFFGWSLILLFFLSIFLNYTLFLKGFSDYNFSWNNFLSFSCYFFLTLVMSWGILGVPSLYFIWFILMFSYIYKFLRSCKYNIKNTFSLMAYELREEGEFWMKNDLRKKYDLGYSKGFNYGFLYFLEFASNFTDPFCAEYPLKCPFIYYPREWLILATSSSHFKMLISENGFMSSECMEWVLQSVFEDLDHLDFQYWEADFWRNSLKKIYKKTYKKSLVMSDDF